VADEIDPARLRAAADALERRDWEEVTLLLPDYHTEPGAAAWILRYDLWRDGYDPDNGVAWLIEAAVLKLRHDAQEKEGRR